MAADNPRAWLRARLEKNERENQIAQNQIVANQDTSSRRPDSVNVDIPGPSNLQQGTGTDSEESASKLTYENDNLKLTVEQVDHKQEKRFRLVDHLFHLKLVNKKNKTQMPMLSDILTFLHAGFLFIITKIKKFYKPEDRNIAFMTLHQDPMIGAINTDMIIYLFRFA